MSFDSPLFIFFLSAFLVIYYCLPSARSRQWLLLSGGMIFLATQSGVSWLILCFILGATYLTPRTWATFSIFSVVLVLVTFKWLQPILPNQFFPIGLSFYAFACITYLVDISNGDRKLNFAEYGSALAFFPTLVSGPIVRLTDLSRRIVTPAALDWELARPSAVRIATGFFKKSVSELISASIMSNLNQSPWLTVMAFTAKYYADFSGYSDIAIGVAGLLGVSIPENFNLPFLATSIGDFWRRWHMSLNWWTNQYVFRSLVFTNALSLFPHREYVAAMIAMFVIGVWHGFTWNYACWGLYMGLFLCLEMAGLFRWREQGPKLFRILVTFFIVLNGFVIFMSANVQQVLQTWSRMYAGKNLSSLTRVEGVHLTVVLFVLLVPHLVDAGMIRTRYLAKRAWWAALACVLLLSLHFYLDGFNGAPFEYSKF